MQKKQVGKRTIAQPAKEVKSLQYWVIKHIFPKLKIHRCAIAYVKGKGIKDNARPHAQNPYMIKIDFSDFFPSIKGTDFIKLAEDQMPNDFDQDDLDRIIKILFWRPKNSAGLRLSIGAPSSPYLSNAMMYKFDSEILTYCLSTGISYTRYADDLTFSMQKRDSVAKYLKKSNKL